MRTSRMGRWVARGIVIVALGLGALAAVTAAAPGSFTPDDTAWTLGPAASSVR